MFFRKPRLQVNAISASYDLLQDALAQYGVTIDDTDGHRQLRSLDMDDIDFLEAIILVERAVNAKIDRRALGPSTTVNAVVGMFDAARNMGRG